MTRTSEMQHEHDQSYTANNLREAAFDISRVLTEAGIDPRKTIKSIRNMLEKNHRYGQEYSAALNKGCSMGKWAAKDVDLRIKETDVGLAL